MKKTVIVVGAGNGLGNAVAREFAKHDFKVALISRRKARLDAYEAEFKKDGIEVCTKVADATNPESLTMAIRQIQGQFGTPAVLVYNVGITELESNTITSEILTKRYQVDCASAWHCAHLVATEDFAQNKGCILFTGGEFDKAHMMAPGIIPLVIDKAALKAMNGILHDLMEPRGIFVGSIVVNGVISEETEHNAENIAKAYWKMYEERKEYEVLA